MSSIENESRNIITNTENESVKKKCCGIYGLRCRTTNKWYVGQSIDIKRRLNSYRLLQCKRQINIHNALIKYGYEDFECVVLESHPDVCEWILDYREMYWIKILDTVNNGYNLTYGGHGCRLGKESRKKLSMSKTGTKHTEETISKLKSIKGSTEYKEKVAKTIRSPEWKAWFKEIMNSPEVREKVKKNRKVTEESIRKMREAKLGKKPSPEIIQKRVEGLKRMWVRRKEKALLSQKQSQSNP